ncbi:MAG: dTDP-4-dehydrorhamnose 3,5-epimerase [Rhodospirillaceae bacterium]|nr:dTDP-4-dehydrorhamnose 3,5-epimerase [Rhodospirillaceae bacterium]
MIAAEPFLLPGLFVLEPKCFSDPRGFFVESYNARDFSAVIGRDVTFVQDNHSCSVLGALRGLHFQTIQPQGKLVRVVRGAVFDVAVDLRRDSPTFKRWAGLTLSAENRKQFWIPEGFAHGFVALTEEAEFLYKVTDYWCREGERTLHYDDPAIGIDWPTLSVPYRLSDKDAAAPYLDQLDF